jgi:hypothetical protein
MTLNAARTPTYSFPDIDGEARLRELILYIAGRCERDPRFGAVKLNKILAFADFTAYFRRRRPITGVEYMRLPQGPVPRRLKPITVEMEQNGDMVIRTVQDGKFEQKRVVPLRTPNLGLFAAEDIAIVDEMIQAFWGRTAKAVSKFSHGMAWKVAGDRELIPYEAVFLSDEELTDYDIARTHELAQRFGWRTEGPSFRIQHAQV